MDRAGELPRALAADGRDSAELGLALVQRQHGRRKYFDLRATHSKGPSSF